MSKRLPEQSVKIEFVMGSANVYADLGLPNPEMREAKAALMRHVNAEIKRLGLTKTQAAKAIGMTQADVSNISRGQGRRYPMERLLKILHRLGIASSIRVDSDGVDVEIPVYSATCGVDVVRDAFVACLAGLAALADLSTLRAADDGLDFHVDMPASRMHETTLKMAGLENDVADRFGVRIQTLAVPCEDEKAT